ncbi:hypothetical protein LS70_003785 [Helicobacter sp. MIT 11-5569]|uniref:hypothetical protein n=1 Tax=Helicobacter sp. MIT 11-5569 TaxID=1548151 RepID=UPI00051FBEC3|nr:hypothetical protein [Helicobacter sp. MIT 11-5569]TLD83939.1 hypothetical protein LS70_003785 [Helicobacter sp. MIT 11-5569]
MEKETVVAEDFDLYGGFEWVVTTINTLMYSAHSSLPARTHESAFVLLCEQLAKLAYLIKNEETTGLEFSDPYFGMCEYCDLLVETYTLSYACFNIGEFDEPFIAEVKKIANVTLLEKITEKIEEEENDGLFE